MRDPVCVMTIDPAGAAGSSNFEEKPYYFCSKSCEEKFDADPPKYLQPTPTAANQGSGQDAWYTCPMHPEVRQNGPGSCPKCGMALEPEILDGDAPEIPGWGLETFKEAKKTKVGGNQPAMDF